jgi:hypothetical protein
MAEAAVCEAPRTNDSGERKGLSGNTALLTPDQSESSRNSAHLEEKNRFAAADERYKTAGVLPGDFQITGLQDSKSQSAKYTLYEQPASQALRPLPLLPELAKTGPYDSDTKLNVQITNVPEVSPAMTGQQVLNYFETTSQVGAAAVHPIEEHLAQPNAINKDLTNVGLALYGFPEYAAHNPDQLIIDGKNAIQWASRQAENISEKLDKAMTPEQRAEMAGAVLPLFFMDGEPLSPKASKQMELENMSAEQLEGLGIKKAEIPIQFERDQSSIQARVPGYPRAICRVETPSPGVVECTDLFRGGLPEGTGNSLLSETLKTYDVMPSKQLVLKGIINPPTLQAYSEGAAAEDTLVAKSATKALKSLGITPSSYQYEVVGDKLNIIIETGSK